MSYARIEMAITPNITIRQQSVLGAVSEGCVSMSCVNCGSRQILCSALSYQPKMKDETNRAEPIPLAFPWGQPPLYDGDQDRASLS